MSDREQRFSDAFPAIGEIDNRLLAKQLFELRKDQRESIALLRGIASGQSNLADRVGNMELRIEEHGLRIDHIERSLTVPTEGRRSRALVLRRVPLLVALVAFVLGAGGLALVVALITRTRSS